MQEERIEILIEDHSDKELRHVLSIALDEYYNMCISGRNNLNNFIRNVSWMFTINNIYNHSIEFKHMNRINPYDHRGYSRCDKTYYYNIEIKGVTFYLKYSNKHKYPIQIIFSEIPDGDVSYLFKDYSQIRVGNNYYPPVIMYEQLKKSYVYTYPYIPKHNEKFSKVGYVDIEEALKFPLISFLDFQQLNDIE
jgi:hypothetical protein